jgi:hypothetical protein
MSKGSLIAILCFVVAALVCRASASTEETYTLTEVKYVDLLSLENEAVQTVMQALTNTGALQITGIPRFAMARKRALEDLAECLEDEKAVPELMMADGSRRLSCGASAAAAAKSELPAMSSICGDASVRLRTLVDAGMRQLFLALDTYVTKHHSASSLLMEPSYRSFSEIFSDGRHLEHLHSYLSPTTASDPSSAASTSSVQETMQMHVDAGLFIGMTTGFYSGPPSAQAGLYLQLPNRDTRVRVEVQEDALIVLAGEGARSWLTPVLGTAIRAAPHALVAGLEPRVSQQDGTAATPMTRSWYGKMFLPPADALIPSGNNGEKMRFEEFIVLQSRMSVAKATAAASASSSSRSASASTSAASETLHKQLLPSACGNSYESLALNVAEDCGANEIWCWARCMSTANLDCSSDEYLACYDKQSHTVVSGDDHCMGGNDDSTGGIYCQPTCVLNTTDVQTGSSSQFCYGKGTTMFMQGFQAQKLTSEDDTTSCVTLLFQDWTLDSRVKFAFACLGVFLLSALTQAVPLMRKHIIQRFSPNSAGLLKDKRVRDLLLALLFGIDKTIGYFVMLVAMTYSVELFTMICLGITAGFIYFHLWNGGNPEDAKWGDICCDEDDSWKAGSSPSKRLLQSKGNELQKSLLQRTTLEGAELEGGSCCAGTSEDI